MSVILLHIADLGAVGLVAAKEWHDARDRENCTPIPRDDESRLVIDFPNLDMVVIQGSLHELRRLVRRIGDQLDLYVVHNPPDGLPEEDLT